MTLSSSQTLLQHTVLHRIIFSSYSSIRLVLQVSNQELLIATYLQATSYSYIQTYMHTCKNNILVFDAVCVVVLQPSATVCNRMRSGSAAAIAVQQTRNSAIFHDKDNLIANDSIVVYDQRTAL